MSMAIWRMYVVMFAVLLIVLMVYAPFSLSMKTMWVQRTFSSTWRRFIGSVFTVVGGFINLCFVKNSSKNGYLRSRGMNVGIRLWICVLWFCHQLLEIRATSFLWSYRHIHLCHVPNPTHHSASHKLVRQPTSSGLTMYYILQVQCTWHDQTQFYSVHETLQQQHVW